MRISKKLNKQIMQAIDDFLINEIKEIIESDYPPDQWSDEEKNKVDAFCNASYKLQDKINEILNGKTE